MLCGFLLSLLFLVVSNIFVDCNSVTWTFFRKMTYIYISWIMATLDKRLLKVDSCFCSKF